MNDEIPELRECIYCKRIYDLRYYLPWQKENFESFCKFCIQDGRCIKPKIKPVLKKIGKYVVMTHKKNINICHY